MAFPSFFTLNSRTTNTKVGKVREIGMMVTWRQAKQSSPFFRKQRDAFLLAHASLSSSRQQARTHENQEHVKFIEVHEDRLRGLVT